MMKRTTCTDIHELFLFSVVLATGAALLNSTSVAMWALVVCFLAHTIYQTSSTPLIAVLLAPYVFTASAQAAQCMSAAAYFFFFVALETEPRTQARNPVPAVTLSASTSTDPPVVNPVAEV